MVIHAQKDSKRHYTKLPPQLLNAPIKPSSFKIFIYLKSNFTDDFQNDKTTPFILSQRNIAENLGMNERTVMRGIEELKKNSMIKVHEIPVGTNQKLLKYGYTINDVEDWT